MEDYTKGLDNVYYYANPDLCFVTNETFDQTVNWITVCVEDNPELPTKEDILVIEIPDGVFIRSLHPEWSISLAQLISHSVEGVPQLKEISLQQWNDMTTKYRGPINSFGDDHLARWKVG